MKKLIMLAIAAVCVCGCEDIGRENEIQATGGKVYPISDRLLPSGAKVFVVQIDGHDYLLLSGWRRAGICHSATCPCHDINNK